MPCNNKKDLSRLVAKTRIRVFTSRYFWDAYLWPDAEEMWKQSAVVPAGTGRHSFTVVPDTGEPSIAHVSRSSYVERFTRPWWAPQWTWDNFVWPLWLLTRTCSSVNHFWPRLGEIHFVANKGWDMETVAHEVLHAAISTARAFGLSPSSVFYCGPLSQQFMDTPIYRSAESQYKISINDEELFCYIHGMMFDNVYHWLWKVNPPYDARRSEWSLP